jgi:hypothetical protein
MEEVPEEFTCPITQDIMTDPVTTICGHTFERQSITTWFRARSTCPCDNTHLASKHLSPNFALKHAIETYAQHRPLLAMKQQHETDFALAVQLREEFLQTQQEKHPLSSASSSSDASSSSSCPQNLTDFLSKLGLSQYNKNFQEAHVDLELLEGLDDGEWIEVFDACKVPIGARIKIKKSIRNHKGSTNANTNDTQREVKVRWVGGRGRMILSKIQMGGRGRMSNFQIKQTILLENPDVQRVKQEIQSVQLPPPLPLSPPRQQLSLFTKLWGPVFYTLSVLSALMFARGLPLPMCPLL